MSDRDDAGLERDQVRRIAVSLFNATWGLLERSDRAPEARLAEGLADGIADAEDREHFLGDLADLLG